MKGTRCYNKEMGETRVADVAHIRESLVMIKDLHKQAKQGEIVAKGICAGRPDLYSSRVCAAIGGATTRRRKLLSLHQQKSLYSATQPWAQLRLVTHVYRICLHHRRKTYSVQKPKQAHPRTDIQLQCRKLLLDWPS